jgi:hypothetical protein
MNFRISYSNRCGSACESVEKSLVHSDYNVHGTLQVLAAVGANHEIVEIRIHSHTLKIEDAIVGTVCAMIGARSLLATSRATIR